MRFWIHHWVLKVSAPRGPSDLNKDRKFVHEACFVIFGLVPLFGVEHNPWELGPYTAYWVRPCATVRDAIGHMFRRRALFLGPGLHESIRTASAEQLRWIRPSLIAPRSTPSLAAFQPFVNRNNCQSGLGHKTYNEWPVLHSGYISFSRDSEW